MVYAVIVVEITELGHPLDWYLDGVLLLALPKKDVCRGLAVSPQAMEVVVS